MFCRRISPRLVALLAYALVVNALVWSGIGGHRVNSSGVFAFCIGGDSAAKLRARSALPVEPALHCEIACASAGALTLAVTVAPVRAVFGQTIQADVLSPNALAATRWPWQARGPPLLV